MSGRAVKPGDVVTAMNGKTIQVCSAVNDLSKNNKAYFRIQSI